MNNKNTNKKATVADYEDKYKHLRNSAPVNFNKQGALSGIEKEPGWHYYGFDDNDLRIEQAVRAGYEFVRADQDRTAVDSDQPHQQGSVLRVRVNQGDYRNISSHQVIMRKPLDLYHQHTKERLAENDKRRKQELDPRNMRKDGFFGEMSQSKEMGRG